MAKENELRIYCVYKHTNKANGKVYIGQTRQKPEVRWDDGKGYESCTHFYSAIEKYGWQNFDHEILHDKLTSDEADCIESKLIAEYDSTNPTKGYNLMSGGKRGRHSDESKTKISKANKGKPSPNRGRRLSVEILHLRIGDENLEKLRNKADEYGESVSTIARIAISEYLKREENRVK